MLNSASGTPTPNASFSLDPADWKETRELAHGMLDDMLDFLQKIREFPVWQKIPDAIRERFHQPIPTKSSGFEDVYREFQNEILPYSSGNAHPGFMGWVQGGGTYVGMLAELLAGGLNANLGGRDHAPIEVEKQIVHWMRELFSFPSDATGLFVTGSSIANFLGLLIAKHAVMGLSVRNTGIDDPSKWTIYTSTAAHRCIAQAVEMMGLGSDQLRKIQVDSQHRMDIEELERILEADHRADLRPVCIVGSAGTVDVGAIDDLVALRRIADREGIPLHIDGAYAALGMMSPNLRSKLVGITEADSIAFDFHKWTQVPYDAGFLLVRNGKLHLDSFHTPADYLARDPRAMAAGSPWPCDLGPDLSRGFRALKTWMTLRVFGTQRLGSMMDHTCELASYLGQRIEQSEELELLAPVTLNIVCYRYRSTDADVLNHDLVAALQQEGLVAPSATKVDGKVAIRAAIFNHRTDHRDLDQLVESSLRLGRALADRPSTLT
ncbi:MAG: pyridoxal-dependent decarboxylase [Pirellulales bacterium]